MTPQTAGMILVFISVFIVAMQIALQPIPFVKRLTNYHLYWFIIGLVFLLYFIFARYMWDLSVLCKWLVTGKITSKDGSFLSPTAWNDGGGHEMDFFKARVIITDFCPFFYVFMCIALMADRSRRIASYAAVGGIIAATLTLGVNIMGGDAHYINDTDKIYSAALSAKYIFIGDGSFNLKFFMHAVLLFMSVGVLLSTPSFKWRHFGYFLGICVIFIMWICAWAFTWNMNENVCGIQPWGWTNKCGDYNAIYKMFALNYVGYPGCVVICLIVLCLIAAGIFKLNMSFQNHLKPYYVPDVQIKKRYFFECYDLNHKHPNTKK